MKSLKRFYGLLIVVILVGCASPIAPVASSGGSGLAASRQPGSRPSAQPEQATLPAGEMLSTDAPAQADASPTARLSPTPDTRLKPEQWQDWPVVPLATNRARQIYQQGQALGADAHAFSKVGDCQSIREVLMGVYDQPERFKLSAADQALQETVDQFSGSFNRDGMAVKGGFNAAAVLSPMWANPDLCQAGETPLECEFRLHKPSFVIISLEVWWQGRTAERYTEYMKRILDFAIAHGVVPILSTKADNVEGDNSINLANAQLAYDYDLPLWNFWRAAQELPNKGLDPVRNDKFHLSMEAWTTRSHTALQALDSVWRGVQPGEEALAAAPTPTPTPEATATPAPTLSAPGINGPAIAASATTLVFGMGRKSGENYLSQGVYLFDLQSGQLLQVAGDGYNLQAVSPDGQRLLLNRGQDLLLTGLDGSNPQRISDQFVSDSGVGATWLPAGTDQPATIALIARRDGENALWLSDENGSNWTRLTQPGASPTEIFPAADTSHVYWGTGSCTPGGICERKGVWATTLDGAQTREVTGVLRPVFSTDGARFAYSYYNQQNKSGLAVSSLDRKSDRKLVIPGSNLIDYAWSPDSKRISALTLVRSDYSGKWLGVRSFILNPPDWSTLELPRFVGINARTLWLPDGSKLLLTATEQLGDGTYRIDFRQIDPGTKKITVLDDKIGMEAVDFIYTTNIFWVPAKY
jgi:hypothetical protein